MMGLGLMTSQNEMIDFSRSLENTDPEEFGGIGNAKSKWYLNFKW